MKVQVEVDVPAGMIVYDVGVGLIKCNRCGETANITYDAPDVSVRMRKFLMQHVHSCITKQPPGVLIHRSGPGVDGWTLAKAAIRDNKPGADTDQGFPK